MMKCPHCNQEHPAGTKFCTETGKPILKSLSAERRSNNSGIIHKVHCGNNPDSKRVCGPIVMEQITFEEDVPSAIVADDNRLAAQYTSSMSSVHWEDYKDFLISAKDEDATKNNPYYFTLVLGLVFGFFIFVSSDGGGGFFILGLPLALLLEFLYIQIRDRGRRAITRRACDIERTKWTFTRIRSKDGGIGLVYWEKYSRAWLMLDTKYDAIIHVNQNLFILLKDNLMGLYNAKREKIVVPVVYDSFSPAPNNEWEFIAVKDGQTSFFSGAGARIRKGREKEGREHRTGRSLSFFLIVFIIITLIVLFWFYTNV